MNAVMRARAGMGAPFPIPGMDFPGLSLPPGTPVYNPFPSSSPSVYSSGGGTLDRFGQITALISKGLDTFLATKLVNSGQFQNAYQNPQYAQYYAQQSQGVGFGIDGSGIRLSDGSHIGWTTIAIVGVGFFLLQSKGFSKR